MSKCRLAVLFGGCSPEYRVSLQSAHGVLTHLDPQKYEPVPLGITRDGRWFLYTGPYDALPDDTWHLGPCCVPAVLSPDRELHGLLLLNAAGPSTLRLDAALPVLHGRNGEDGTVQGLLELAGIPVAGCGVLSSALCMDKELAHQVARASGVEVPRSVGDNRFMAHCAVQWPNVRFIGFEANEWLHDEDRLIAFIGGAQIDPYGNVNSTCIYGKGDYIKPQTRFTGFGGANGTSSFGVTRVTAQSELFAAVSAALERDDKVVVEEEVSGFEVGCAVLGDRDLTLGRPDEIELQKGFFTYDEKYHLITARIHTPARISPSQEQAVQALSSKLYRALDCRGMARVDLFLTPDGRLIFNEINTIPGFTAHSRYPAMMAAAGLSFSQVLDRLIETAVGT